MDSYDKTDYLSEYKNIQKIVNENTNNNIFC